jgi:hypothetical protein
LPADTALTEPSHVCHQGLLPGVSAACQPFGLSAVILAQLLGEIVMPIDQRCSFKDTIDPGLDLGIDLLG